MGLLFVLFCLEFSPLACEMEIIAALTGRMKWVNPCKVLNCDGVGESLVSVGDYCLLLFSDDMRGSPISAQVTNT